MEKYYYLKDNQQYGPCTIEELATKKLSHQTLVWTKKMKNWEAIKDLPFLLERLETPILPPKPKIEVPPTLPTTNKPGEITLATPLQRFLAYLLDIGLVGLVSLLPVIGWIASIVYFFTKDTLPILKGQSIGKRVIQIRVVTVENQQPITNEYDRGCLRMLSLFIPFFGILDAFSLFGNQQYRRFGDNWGDTIVIQELIN